MTELLYFGLVAYGLTQILCFAKILDRIRPDHYFFRCPMCMGFWVGLLLFGVNGFTELFSYEYTIANAFLLSFLASGVSYLITMLVGDNGLKHEHLIVQEIAEEEVAGGHQ